MAPVMRTMLELLESCGDVVMPPFIDEVRFDSHEILDVASPLSLSLGFERRDVVDIAGSLSHESDRQQVFPIGVGVSKFRLPATVTGAVVAREVSD
jgi:hypothetical protein